MAQKTKEHAEIGECDVCEGKGRLAFGISKKALADMRARAIATWAYSKLITEIPDCWMCRTDVCHYFILNMRDGTELFLRHKCSETRCHEFQMGSRMILTTYNFAPTGERWTTVTHSATPLRDLRDSGRVLEEKWFTDNSFPTEPDEPLSDGDTRSERFKDCDA